MPTPIISPWRPSENIIQVDIENIEQGDSVNIYVGEGELGVPELEVEGVIFDSVTLAGKAPDKTFSIVAAFATDNLDASFNLISETEDYYELEPVGDTEVTEITQDIIIPWGDDIEDAAFYEISNLQTVVGQKSRKKISIGKHQTL